MWLGSGVAVAVVWGAAVVLIGPLAWEFPCVMGETLKSQKKKKKKERKTKKTHTHRAGLYSVKMCKTISKSGGWLFPFLSLPHPEGKQLLPALGGAGKESQLSQRVCGRHTQGPWGRGSM